MVVSDEIEQYSHTDWSASHASAKVMKQFDMERPRRRALTQAIAALNDIDSSDSDVDDHGS